MLAPTVRMSARQCLAIGFSIAAATLLLGPYTNYSPPAVDMWFATGYFTNPDDLIQRFGLTYYQASRLPYILPGAALYAAFTPKVANFAINLVVLGTAASSLLAIAVREVDRRWAIALAVLFTLNSYLLGASIWDYSDGPAIAYFLAGLAVASGRAGDDTREGRSLLIAGACWVCAVLTNMIAAVVVAPFAAFILFEPACSWHGSLMRAKHLAAGALLAFAPLAIVSRCLFRHWFFPAPQIEQLLHAAQDPDFLPTMWGTGYAWVGDAYRLAALYGPLLAAAACFARREHRTRKFTATFLACAACGLLYLAAELDGKVLLRSQYHGSFLLACSFIQTVALVRAGTSGKSSTRDQHFGPYVLAIAAVVVALLFIRVHDLNIATWPLLGICVAGLSVAVLHRGHLGRRMCALAASTAVLLNVSTASDGHLRWIYDDYRSLYETTLEAQSLLVSSGVLRGETVRFWHDRDDPQEPLFLAINALYLWDYKDLTKTLPTMSGADMAHVLPAGVTLVHLCSNACPLDERARMLRAAKVDVVSTFAWMLESAGNSPFSISVQKTRPSEPLVSRREEGATAP
jgi:hypothetical protein